MVQDRGKPKQEVQYPDVAENHWVRVASRLSELVHTCMVISDVSV